MKFGIVVFSSNKSVLIWRWGRDPNVAIDVDGAQQLELALGWQVARTNEIAEYVKDEGYVVISGQTNNPNIMARLLQEPLSEYVDAIAVAPYFGRPRPAKWSPKDILPNGFHPLIDLHTNEKYDIHADNIFDLLAGNLEAYIIGNNGVGGETKRMMLEHRAIADLANTGRNNPLQLWSFEGGSDVNCHPSDASYDGFDREAVQELYWRFNQSQQMGKLHENVV